MCKACESAILREAEQVVLVVEAERIVRAAEVDSRRSVPFAIRALFDHEIDAQVRFADIADVTDDATTLATAELSAVQAVASGAIMAAVFQGASKITGPQFIARLTGLEASAWPKDVRRQVEASTDALTAILADAYTESSAVVLGEAARQGVDVKARPLDAVEDVFRPMALSAAAEPYTRALAKTRADLVNPATALGDVSRETVEASIDAAGTAGSVDKARQAIITAAGGGRIDTANRLNPTKAWASELLDGATCERCAEIDGYEYESYESARADYPNGFYYACKGGARCRGTLVLQFEG